MSGLAPNSSNIGLVARPTSEVTRDIAHPEYVYWRTEWQKLRDVLAGQREVKRKQQEYLPRMAGADDEDYALYLRRATFYNMTAQTQNGMLGQVFRADPAVRHLPAKYRDAIKRFAKDGTSLFGFLKTVMAEQIALGRFGVLVDAPVLDPSRRNRPPSAFAVGYTAENIIDWAIEDVDGFWQPTRIVLREFVRESEFITPAPELTSQEARLLRIQADKRPSPSLSPKPSATWGANAGAYTYITVFRELVLEPAEWNADGLVTRREYRQYLYKDDPVGQPLQVVTPVLRGKPLDFIPFVFFGSMSNAPDVERPPLLDICDLNLSHYLTYAELEWGRAFTALPVYYAPGQDDETADVYHIGPSRVWEVPADGATPGILEYTGTGLKALETALNSKEQQIAAIGGRLMPGASKSVSESDNQTVLREANEQSLLLNIIHAAETGISWVVRFWLMFLDMPLTESAEVRVEINQDFLNTPIGAREIRAIQMMYQDGYIPVEILYEYLRKAQIIPSSMEMDEFKGLLNNPDSFLNNPDVSARQRGFADRKQELDQASAAREADISERKVEVAEKLAQIDREKLDIAAKVDSTSVAASRKLGDPEQEQASQADQLTAKTAADAAKTNAQVAGKQLDQQAKAQADQHGLDTKAHQLAIKQQADQHKAAMKAASQPKVAPMAPGSTKAKPNPKK
jgi:hypothetical protein